MKNAFTLVELSIVLVILGLLVGGVLAGQNLIRAAELRSVTTEFTQFQTAVMTFREKYFAIPGDMDNAEAFWGSMTNCAAASPSGSGTQTCNGNADGTIDSAGAAGQTGEVFGFWQQLSNAGLIEGTYTGIAGSGGVNHSAISENIPTSRLNGAGWSVRNNLGANTTNYNLDYDNLYAFGSLSGNEATISQILVPEEAWGIDKKIDDGLPAQGQLVVRFWDTCTDSTSNTDVTGEYLLSDTTIQCTLLFRKAF